MSTLDHGSEIKQPPLQWVDRSQPRTWRRIHLCLGEYGLWETQL